MDLAFLRFVGFDPTRAGSFLLPVSRFHSSKVSLEIFPSTRSSANLRRCAWLLNGMSSFLTESARACCGGLCLGSRSWLSNDADVTVALEYCQRHIAYFSHVPIATQILEEVVLAQPIAQRCGLIDLSVCHDHITASFDQKTERM